MGTGVLSGRTVNRPERDANHIPLSIAEVKNEWGCTSTPPLCAGGVDRVTSPFSYQFHLVGQQTIRKITDNTDTSVEVRDVMQGSSKRAAVVTLLTICTQFLTCYDSEQKYLPCLKPQYRYNSPGNISVLVAMKITNMVDMRTCKVSEL